MPSNYPSTAIWQEMAERLGCEVAVVKAVFEVEAAGKFYESNGKLPRRFEPHHFPRTHWDALGFAPREGQAAWRASLRVSTSRRRAMFDIAENIDAEATFDASSWGAPQIMGFNAELAGYASAIEMVDAFEQSADEQIRGFVNFVINANLGTYLRSQDFHAFAYGYNGSGQAAVYAGRIESAYRRQSGGQSSSPVLRVGRRGQAVEQMQLQLAALGYDIEADGVFGAGTARTLRKYQQAHGLMVDGVAGATTLAHIAAASGENIEPSREDVPETTADRVIDLAIERGGTVVGSGGVVGLLSNVSDTNQTIIIAGGVVGALILAALWILKKKGRSR